MLLENIEVMVIIKPLTMTFNLFQNQLPQQPLPPPKPLLKPPVLKAKQTSILCMMILKRN